MTPDLLTVRLRTGRRVPQNLYAQLAEEPSNVDPSVGWARTPEIARQAVDAVDALDEGRRPPGDPWQSLGRLVYNVPFNGSAETLVSGWIIAVASEDLAARIADAANGHGDRT